MTRLRRRASSRDGRAVLLLLVVPALVFVLPALAGHPAVAGDNVIQNLPLRVYTGRLLRGGELPLWNPLIWSGSPLLGGLNAGSAYPLTWVFTFLPPVAGWVVNLLVTYWVGGLGAYALLRQYRLEPLPSLLGAVVYSYSGAMAAQMVHLPIVQGMAFVPVAVLCELRLARAVLGVPLLHRDRPESWRREGSPWAWTVALTGALAMILLTGEPRGMAEAEIVASVTALWLVLRPRPAGRLEGSGSGGRREDLVRRLQLVGLLLLAAVWASALGCVQLLPGWSFISTSQRASETLSFFGAGSLRPSWTALLLLPNLFGGDGLLHQPIFFNSYNLPEVTGYVGLVPLAAAVGLLARTFGRGRDPRRADWGLWLVLLGLGLLLTWGTYTWLGGLFGHIPFFGKTRLQSRNLGIVDLALAVLLAFWAQRAWGGGSRAAGLTGRRRWLTLAPVGAAIALCAAAIALPARVESAFAVPGGATYLGRYLTPWFIASLLVALAIGALLLGWSRWTATVRRRGLCALVVVDVLLFTASSSTGLSAGHVTLEPERSTAVAVLGDHGRFAMADPASNVDHLSPVGQPDLNVYTGLESVQGYGSLVTGRYGNVTGTHLLDTLNPCALQSGEFRQLRLSTMLVAPSLLAPPANWKHPPHLLEEPKTCDQVPAPGVRGRRNFYFGQPLTVRELVLFPVTGQAGILTRAAPRIGLVGTDGRTFAWPGQRAVRVRGGVWAIRVSGAPRAMGVTVRGPARAVSNTSMVITASNDRYHLDGQLQDPLGRTVWRLTGVWNGYARFATRSVRPPVWLSRRDPGSSVRQVRVTVNGGEVDHVVARTPVEVVRSEASDPGWTARAVPVHGGRPRQLQVTTVGLVQAVQVPAGDWNVTFSYWPPRFTAGLVTSGAGVLALLASAAVWLVRRRSRRADRHRAHASAR